MDGWIFVTFCDTFSTARHMRQAKSAKSAKWISWTMLDSLAQFVSLAGLEFMPRPAAQPPSLSVFSTVFGMFLIFFNSQ